MAGSKEIKRRMQSVANTQQITSAMKMVSASKLRKVQGMVGSSGPYQAKLQQILAGVRGSLTDTSENPFLVERPIKRTGIVIFTSNKGLAGGYNNHIIEKAVELAKEKQAQGIEVGIIAVGRKAKEHFERHGFQVDQSFLDVADVPSVRDANRISRAIRSAYMSEEYDEIYLAYQHFRTVMSQVPTTVRVLPVEADKIGQEDSPEEESKYANDYAFEPDSNSIMTQLLDLYFAVYVQTALIEAKAGEHGARMTAMTAATDNAADLLSRLELSYNRARQAAITSEITEIVAGVNALG